MEKKDEAEEEAKLQLRAQAKQELDDWYKQHAEQVDIVIIIYNTVIQIQHIDLFKFLDLVKLSLCSTSAKHHLCTHDFKNMCYLFFQLA